MSSGHIKSQIDLNKLVDLALNSPKIGIVNFNVLKTFLVELLKALNLQNYEPKFGESDVETKSLIQELLKNQQHDDSLVSQLNETGYGSEIINVSLDGPVREPKPLNERFFSLEEKLGRLEQQISALNQTPSNSLIIEKAKESRKSGGGPILEVWQYTQLSKRLESNEEGLTRLTSLMQDLIGDLNEIKDAQVKNTDDVSELKKQLDSLRNQLKQFEKMKDNFPSLDDLKDINSSIDLLQDRLKDMDNLNDKVKEISNKLRNIEIKIENCVTKNDTIDLVTWDSLEKSLKGLKDQLNAISNKEIQSQSTQTRSSLQSPSPALVDLLAKLGTLNDRHDRLQKLVDELRDELLAKLRATPASPDFKLPDDFASKLDEIMSLKGDMLDLKQNMTRETNKRVQLENSIMNLNNEIDKLKIALRECLESTQINKNDIQSLKEAISLLEQAKFDKDWIRREFDKKADKRDIESKVGRKLFDESMTDVSHNLNNCLQKTCALEDSYKRDQDRIMSELEAKLDRLELEPFKEYIEKQLRKIKKLQKETQQGQMDEEQAAGMRRPYMRYNCISCDRPVDAVPHQAVPSLPSKDGVRPIQSPRPFTTYELDQIRQYQKQQTIHDTGYELFSSVRPCGGSHTMTLPHKKFVRVPPQISEESAIIPTYRSEVHIQGADGNIYKGRIDARLSVEMRKSATKSANPNNAQHHLNVNNVSLTERPVSVPVNKSHHSNDKIPTH